MEIVNEKEEPNVFPTFEYKRVNFLNAFRKMGFEFLKDEPSLLVEKILSVDPEWIGYANYEGYGGHRDKFQEVQSNATKVPCLEGEWILVCYSKKTKRVAEEGVWYGSEWHKYYLCQIDFSQEHLFRMVKDFKHTHDAFQYLYDNRLVAVMKSDKMYLKQISVKRANIALSVLNDVEKEEQELTYDELLKVFGKHYEKSKEISEFIINSEHFSKGEKARTHYTEEEICRRIGRFLPREPYQATGYAKKLTIKQYLEMVRGYKENYVWNI